MRLVTNAWTIVSAASWVSDVLTTLAASYHDNALLVFSYPTLYSPTAFYTDILAPVKTCDSWHDFNVTMSTELTAALKLCIVQAKHSLKATTQSLTNWQQTSRRCRHLANATKHSVVFDSAPLVNYVKTRHLQTVSSALPVEKDRATATVNMYRKIS